jgi:Arc/MetJ family transcription regulator
MRTNIVIDDNLMLDVLHVTGLKTKREAVELGLKTLLMLKKQDEIKQFKGKLKWEETLDNANIFRKLAFPNVSLNKNWETSAVQYSKWQ